MSGLTTSTTPTDPSGVTGKQVSDFYGLPHFDPKGEPNSLSVPWKRAFNLYVASKGVINEGQRIALLLHSGGMELQKIYYTLVPEDTETTFNDCLAALDNYFTAKVNVPFERHVFHQMQQIEGETMDQFVCHVRKPYLVILLMWMKPSETRSLKNVKIRDSVENFSRKRVMQP